MNEQEEKFIVPFMMGRAEFDAAFEHATSDRGRAENLSSAAYYFERALSFAPDEESEMECHRLLGAVLFTLNFHSPMEIADHGLSNLPGLNKAIASLEKALELDAHTGEKFFSARAIAAEVFLRLDTVWMYESLHVDNQYGALRAAKYLQDKLMLLEYLGGVHLPGVHFMLFQHYADVSFPSALVHLERAANGEIYEDVAKTSKWHLMSSQYKTKAQEVLAQMRS